jgi:hypothetical protein
VDRHYQSIAPEYSRHRRVHAEVLRNLISIGKLDAASRVLGGGCGTGNYLRKLNPRAPDLGEFKN